MYKGTSEEKLKLIIIIIVRCCVIKKSIILSVFIHDVMNKK